LKLDLCEKVSSYPVDFVELTIAPAEGTVIRILSKPVALAVRADWLLTDLALKRILQEIVADSANQLW